jgi:hypothetical protein
MTKNNIKMKYTINSRTMILASIKNKKPISFLIEEKLKNN